MTNKLPYQEEKIQQYIVQFAHRVPVRKQLTAGEKKALENVLKDLDASVFQLFEETSVQNPACLFQVLCQHPVEATQITLPSFILTNDSFSFVYPMMVLGKKIKGMDLDNSSLNSQMSQWSFKIQEIITNLHSQRVGKIFELVIGPFSPDEKGRILKNIFSQGLIFKEMGEINLTFAYYRELNDSTFNIQTGLHFQQLNLEQPFFITVRVDINNRILSQSLEPQQVRKIWDKADTVIGEHLQTILS